MPSRSPQPFICGRRTLVPPPLVTTALGVAAADPSTQDTDRYAADDVYTVLVCTLQLHRGPLHHSALLNLRGPEAGTVWAVWREDVDPCLALVFPDCPARSDGEACSEFAGHPGAHSWDLTDPPHQLRFAPQIPPPQPPGRPRLPDGRLLPATTRFHRPTTNRNPAP
ncbi:hypothetical protein AB0399_32080 [Streptomyces sp. NPDC088194]|uniref:hypothetical protein n=1 Tax=Streptomyces sp. NPDC088194 TaxID=3154931 RepID=UPI00344F694C